MPNPIIKSLVESDESFYAYAYLEESTANAYGHMKVDIRLPRGSWYDSCVGKVTISCQIGSGNWGEKTQDEVPYGWDCGYVHGSYKTMKAQDLDAAAKVMRRIDKGMQKIADEHGQSTSYAGFCNRVLLSLKLTTMIVEPGLGWVNGGLMEDKELVTTRSGVMFKLMRLEEALIARFARLAA